MTGPQGVLVIVIGAQGVLVIIIVTGSQGVLVIVTGPQEYYIGELELNAKLRVFAVNCSLLYGGHNSVQAQLHVKSKRGQVVFNFITSCSIRTPLFCERDRVYLGRRRLVADDIVIGLVLLMTTKQDSKVPKA